RQRSIARLRPMTERSWAWLLLLPATLVGQGRGMEVHLGRWYNGNRADVYEFRTSSALGRGGGPFTHGFGASVLVNDSLGRRRAFYGIGYELQAWRGRSPRPAAAHATRYDQRQCRGRGADRHRVAGDAVHLGRHGGQRVRLLGTDSIRLRSARHSPAAHEPRSGPCRGRGGPGRGRAPSRGRAAVLRAPPSRRDARW